MKKLFLLLVLCVFCCEMSFAQESGTITVRIVDYKKGTPTPKHQVFVYWLDPATHLLFVKQGLPLRGWTDADGVIKFSVNQLRQLAPQQSQEAAEQKLNSPRRSLIEKKIEDIYISDTTGGVDCSWPNFSFEEILKTGVVGDNRCDSKFDTKKYKALPGELILFVGHYHWWEGQN